MLDAGHPAAHRSAGSTRSAASLKWRSIVLLAAVAAEVFPMPAWLMIARADALTRRRATADRRRQWSSPGPARYKMTVT